MSLFGNFFGTDPQQIQTTQTQTRTANPLTQQGAQSTYDWLAAAQAQPYSNMPMQQIAGFTPDQQAAFEATRAAQGQANPWFTQAGNLVTAGAGFDPTAVAATYKDLSTPVLASLYDQFGQQRSQMAGNLRSAAGGTGADRINVGLADLAKQQGLAAGQTESGLLATAINTEMQKRQMMQSAGALTGQLGGQQQAATYADIANLYGMGGQQQQLAQAQQNAQYQYGLGQFMYPSQLAQMGAGITAGLAPALGGTTTGTGTKTVPGQPIGTTLAGLGMTALGAYMSGGTSLIPGLLGGATRSATPNGGVSAGGRIGYDEGGEVEAPPQRPFDYGRAGNRLMMAGLKMASKRPSFDSAGGRISPYSILDKYNLGGMVPHYEDGGEVPWALDDRWDAARELAGSRSAKDEFAPAEYASAAGFHRTATPEQAEPFIQQIADRSIKLDPEAHDRWAAGVDDTNRDRLPPIMTAGMRPQLPAGATAYADDTDTDTVPRQSPYLPSRRVPIPPLPDYGDLGRPDKSGEIYRNPWMALMGAGLGTMAAASERNPDGTLKHPGILSAVGKGGLHGVEMLREQQKSALEEKRAELELRKSLEAAQHWRTTAEIQQAQAARPYEEPTAVQRETIRHQREMEKRPFELYTKTDPVTFEKIRVMGVPDSSSPTGYREIKPDGSAGDPAAPAARPIIKKGDEVPEPVPVGGLTSDAIKLGAQQYFETGKTPGGGSRNPAILAQNNAVKNYAAELAASAGMTPDEIVQMWRFAPRQAGWIMGADGRAAGALGTLVDHLDTARDLMKALHNGEMQLYNEVKNRFAAQFGQPAPTNVQAASQIIGTEVMKAIGAAGAGMGEERATAAKAVASLGASSAQSEGSIDTIQRLAAGQLRTKKRQAEAIGLDEKRLKTLVGERAWGLLSSLDEGGGSKTGTKTEAVPAMPKTKADFDALPSGQLYIDPKDGKKYRKP